MKKFLTGFTCFAIALLSVFTFFACDNPEPPPVTVSVWDGEIPGWNNPNLPDSSIVANRPSTYVVDETNKTIDINDASAFVWFAYRSVLGEEGFKGYTIKLNIDIDLDNNLWIPIGMGGRSNAPKIAFQGTFNGQNHKIFNISNDKFRKALHYGFISEDAEQKSYYIEYKSKKDKNLVANIPIEVKTNSDFDEYFYGLFATTKDATIKNLIVEGVNFDVSPIQLTGAPRKVVGDSVGAIVGFARGSTTLENCTAGRVRVGEDFGKIKGGTYTAGLVGSIYAGTDSGYRNQMGMDLPFGEIKLINCTNNLDVIATDDRSNETGGIVSYAQFYTKLTVENCVNNGNVSGTACTGGIIGYMASIDTNNYPTELTPEEMKNLTESHTKFNNCVNNGKIMGKVGSVESSFYYLGGLIGYRAVNSVTSSSSYIIENCKNMGEIVLESVTPVNAVFHIGGLAGHFQVKGAQTQFISCSNSGNITFATTSTEKVNIGFLIGTLNLTDANASNGQLEIKTCSNSGNIYHTEDQEITIREDKCSGSILGTNEDLTRLVVIPETHFINSGNIIPLQNNV